MGYEIARSVNEIDDEFLCSICTMVLENPLQSPCEHIFCSECIKDWLKVEARCPVDRFVLAPGDLKPTPRYFRNMLDKVEVKCSFEPKGCQTVHLIEHLKDHLNKCTFNPTSEIICDKGCNIKMTRKEYEMSDCFKHLENRFSHQLNHFENLISRLEEQITKLNNEVGRQREQIKKQSKEISRVRSKGTQSENELRLLQENLSKLNDKSDILNIPQQCRWETCRNLKTDQQNILEYSASFGNALARLLYPLGPTASCYKIRILSMISNCSICIGLTTKQHPNDEPPGMSIGSFGYRCNGELYVDKKCQKIEYKGKIGDVIECGIKFPINEGTNSVDVYFSINDQLITKNNITMPSHGLFPTIFMWGPPVSMAGSVFSTIGKVQYLRN